MRILAVDDDEIILDILEHLILKSGHEVTLASRGDEAFELLQQQEFQMVISDWEMPGLSGIELCRKVRSHDFGHYIYTIMLTSRSSTEEFVRGMSAGADDFVTKPFNAAEMRMRILAGERILSLETRDMLIFALAKLAESRDPDTGHHLERVQRYSRLLASHLSARPEYEFVIDSSFIRNIFLTSPLHDIGKVGIPDSVLLKPGRLTESEYEVMKEHTLIGANTLKQTFDQHPEVTYLQMAIDITQSHHERFDGTGYPHGLSGEDIPLSARIVAIADVYDALTTRRVYKEAYSHEKTRRIMQESSGSHFDPTLVEAFLEIEDEFIDIRQQFFGDQDLPLEIASEAE